MDYEQRYNDALAKAKEQLNGAKVFDYDNEQIARDKRTTVYNIFPELNESENEKIRKGIIKSIMDLSNDWLGLHGVIKEDAITWLEKQGEHVKFRDPIQVGDKVTRNRDGMLVNLSQLKRAAKPTDKVEPKFKDGQWIVWKDKCYKVNYNGCGYELVDLNGLSTSLEYETIDESAHLWDITKDAKEGDILHSPSHHLIWIYKDSRQYYACVNTKYARHYNFDANGLLGIPKDVFPATKDEQTILFERMKEAGYEWNADKKELKKL